MPLLNVLLELTQQKEEFLRKLFQKSIYNMITESWKKKYPDEEIDERKIKLVYERWDANYLFSALVKIDSSPNNQYTQWLITRFFIPLLKEDGILNATYRLREDADDIQEMIMTHFNKKNSSNFPKEYKDINKVDSLKTLKQIVKPYLFSVEDISVSDIANTLVKEKLQEGTDYKLIYEDSFLAMYKIESEIGACTIGAKSSWCTSYGDYSLNKRYRGYSNAFADEDSRYRDDLFAIVGKTDDRIYFQISMNGDQMMDIDDDPISWDRIKSIILLGGTAEKKKSYQSMCIAFYDFFLANTNNYDTNNFVVDGNKVYEKFKDYNDFFSRYLTVDDAEEASALEDGGSHIFYNENIELSRYDEWNGETINFIKEHLIPLLKEEDESEEIDEVINALNNIKDSDDLVNFLDLYKDDYSEIETVYDNLSEAKTRAQESADEGQKHNTFLKTALENFNGGLYSKEENFKWESNSLLVLKTVKSDNPTDYFKIEATENYFNQHVDPDNFESVQYPRYGWDGDIDWDYANDEAVERFSW